jgi:hypothetical protein
VTLTTEDGDITLKRTDGKMATFTAPRTPPRSVALRRREVSALLTEELRRLDTDHVFLESMAESPPVDRVPADGEGNAADMDAESNAGPPAPTSPTASPNG